MRYIHQVCDLFLHLLDIALFISDTSISKDRIRPERIEHFEQDFAHSPVNPIIMGKDGLVVEWEIFFGSQFGKIFGEICEVLSCILLLNISLRGVNIVLSNNVKGKER